MSSRTLLLIGLAACVVVAFTVVERVPDGRAVVLIPRGGETPAVLGPGLHLRRFGAERVTYATEARVTGRVTPPAAPPIAYTLDVAIDPPRLADLHASMQGAPLEDFLHMQMSRLLERVAGEARPAEVLTEEFRRRASEAITSSMTSAGFLRADLTIDPPDAQVLLDAALTLAAGGEAWELRIPVNAALVDAPRDWRLHTALALVNESESLISEAETGYLEALALEPSALPPMERLVTIYTAVEQWDRLQRILDAALAANPRSIQHINWTAVVLIKKGDRVGAERILRDGLALAPDNATLLANLGVLLMNTGREEEAVETFRHAVTSAPDSGQALFNLGSALAATDRWEEALEHLTQAERTGHATLPLTETLAIVHEKLGHTEEATRYREAAAAIRDTSAKPPSPTPGPGS